MIQKKGDTGSPERSCLNKKLSVPAIQSKAITLLKRYDPVMTGYGRKRTDSASRVIKASPRRIYQALLDPKAIVEWRPPEGMKAEIHAFDPREGGRFRMSFLYCDREHGGRGKTSEHADVFQGRFIELIPDKRVVELIEFVSDDPALAGRMTVTTSLAQVAGGTEVTITCENVPSGISFEDHQTGMASTLHNLAAYAE